MYPLFLKKIKYFLPLLFLLNTAFAQTAKKKKYLALEKTWWIEYNPLTLAEPEVPIAITAQYKANKFIGISLDAGVYFAKHDYDIAEPYSGLRLRPEIKFFVDGERRGARGFYVALQGLYKNTTAQKAEWLSRRDLSGQAVFNQFANYKERKVVAGGSLLAGGEFILGERKKWMIDVFAGFGFRKKHFTAIDLPQGITIDYDRINEFGGSAFTIYKNGFFVSGSLGFKIGYRIN